MTPVGSLKATEGARARLQQCHPREVHDVFSRGSPAGTCEQRGPGWLLARVAPLSLTRRPGCGGAVRVGCACLFCRRVLWQALGPLPQPHRLCFDSCHPRRVLRTVM